MRILAVPLVGVALLLGACGSESGTSDAAGSGAGAAPTTPAATATMPTAVPAADGPVRTRQLATVMDTGTPELCVGPVAESFPPQCGGPEIVGWSWKTHGRRMFERQDGVRWGSYALTGRWDGTAFTVEEAVPAALYDAMVPEEQEAPAPATTYSPEELDGIAQEVGRLPGARGAHAANGHVVVDVLHDDGSLQAWADEVYGADVVLVISALVPS